LSKSWKDEEAKKNKKEPGLTEEELAEKYKEQYKKETGKRTIFKGKPTVAYAKWLKDLGKIQMDASKKENEKESEKKPKPRTWKDDVESKLDENLEKSLEGLREDLKTYIRSLKSTREELENKLKNLDDVGYIVLLYGVPGIGKSTFCASGVLDEYTVIFFDITNQGRRLKQFPEISDNPNFLYEEFNEKDENGSFDASKSFEKLDTYIPRHLLGRDPKDTILIIDGYGKVIKQLNSYLRRDILEIGDPKSGRQSDVGYGNWYWRTLRYMRILENLSGAANKGFKIFLTAGVKEVTEIKTIEGKLSIKTTGERAPDVRNEDLYAGDIEAFFRQSYDPETDKTGEREIEIKSSKVPGIIAGMTITKPKMKTFIDLQQVKNSKKLEFD
jgi:hypothetical protein